MGSSFLRASAAGVLLCLYVCVSSVSSCLIISEVNCDNPSHDKLEFVELFSLSGGSTSLDGHTLVFYNGNGDVAYRVVSLNGHITDERGFFLIGSAQLTPPPAIELPEGTVQNGPDAIALYGPSWTTVTEGGSVSAVGLLDAVVYTSRRGQASADKLAEVLTPGSKPYLEDEQFIEGDESIQRCWLSDNLYHFQNGPLTPGRANDCQRSGPAHLWINRIQLDGARPTGQVELTVGMVKGPVTVVVYDVRTDTVRTSAVLKTNDVGNVSVHLNVTGLSDLDGWALAVYEQPAAEFPNGSPLSQVQPLDAFVCSGARRVPSPSLTEALIPGRKPFRLNSRSSEGADAYLTRCGVAQWVRDPGVFQVHAQRGGSSRCTWYTTCPYLTALNVTGNSSGTLSPVDDDFLLSEVNADCPGSTEDEEFVELWHPSGRRTSLDGIWFVLLNGNNGRIYMEIELDGYYTDERGYFLIGSDKLNPQISIRPNTIQNGPDAVAIYRSETQPSSEDLGVPKKGLLDAIVYRSRGSDKVAGDLIRALTPGQLPLLEDSSALQGDESLTRCGLNRLDLSSFRVASRTPMQDNDCPRPPEGLLINEVGGVSGALLSPSSVFVELTGPPRTELHGLVVVLFEVGGVRHIVPLQGSVRESGFYILANVSSADQSIPAVASLGAVWLCYGLPSVCSSSSKIQDVIVLSDDPSLRPFLHSIPHQYMPPVPSFDSISRCSLNGSAVWTTSNSTPGHQNLCPSSAYSTNVDLCLQPEHNTLLTCTVERLAAFLELSCQCGISGPHLTGVNITCISESVYVQGAVLALSEHQREQVVQTLHTTDTHSCSAAQERLINHESPLWLQVGLVVAVVLLCALGGAIFFYLYRKRRPQDYYSMELNEHEAPMDL